MDFLEIARSVLAGLTPAKKHDWWVEVSTSHPDCLYYFGPFDQAEEAESARPGYLEDLELEGAQGIQSQVKQCSPRMVTVAHDLD